MPLSNIEIEHGEDEPKDISESTFMIKETSNEDSQKINMDRLGDVKSINLIEESVEEHEEQANGQFMQQVSVPQSLNSLKTINSQEKKGSRNHKSQSCGEIKDLGGSQENGPKTLISNLNESNEAEQVQESVDEKKEPMSPQYQDKVNSSAPQTAENLLRYLDNQWKQKKLESRSSAFNHSRASLQSNKRSSVGSVTTPGK